MYTINLRGGQSNLKFGLVHLFLISINEIILTKIIIMTIEK